MNTVIKAILAGVVVSGLGATTLTAHADESGCHDRAAHRGYGHDRDSLTGRIEQRKTELHDKLKLKPEQEAAWNTFVEKMKPAQPMERPNWGELKKLPAPDRMGKMLDMMKAREGQMENRLAALKEFYATLTPEQQKIFDGQFAHRFSHHSGPMRHDQHRGTGTDGP
ncbi:MAG TPA: Spy/CpxP family protein refolding chaperone [Gammaproteobacteria bacterium]|nr:Spy/CpxP family protein refolding chaperone [Gammaproteobacteria bacterium]